MSKLKSKHSRERKEGVCMWSTLMNMNLFSPLTWLSTTQSWFHLMMKSILFKLQVTLQIHDLVNLHSISLSFSFAGEGTFVWLRLLRLRAFGSRPRRSSGGVRAKGAQLAHHLYNYGSGLLRAMVLTAVLWCSHTIIWRWFQWWKEQAVSSPTGTVRGFGGCLKSVWSLISLRSLLASCFFFHIHLFHALCAGEVGIEVVAAANASVHEAALKALAWKG